MKYFRYLLLILCFWAQQAAVAQAQLADAPSADSRQEVEEIVVVGSRIARRDFFSVSPIVTVDREEIELSGTTDVKNLLNEMPQFDPGAGGGTNNSPFGTARLNLRALGDFRTLVLLNGRRYAANGIFGTADLNALPPVLVDHVEIVSGGASAVYGSDAVAGAVNFVLRNDFDGFESSLQYDVTERGDGDTYSFDVAYGMPFGEGRGNLALFGNFYKRTTIFQDARSFSRVPLTSDDDTGEIISDASFVSPAGGIDGILGVDFYTFNPDGTPRLFVDPDDRFNWASTTALLAPMERQSANAFGHYNFDTGVRIEYEFSYAHSVPEQHRSNSFVRFVDVTVDRPDITPELQNLLASDYDPDGDGIASLMLLRRFSDEIGDAININERDAYRAMLAIEGDLNSGWRWQADASYSDTDRDMRIINDTSVNRIRQGLLVDPAIGSCFDSSGGCVPVNPFGAGNLTQAAADFIALDSTAANERLTEKVVNATLSGPVLQYWAGEMDVVLGAEYRHDRISLTPSESILTGDSLFWGEGPALPSSVISVREIFAETRIPLLRDLKLAPYLGLEIGVRLSDYNILDKDVWTWKFGGEWQLTDGLRLRAMRNRAIRAPSPAELFQDSSFWGDFFFLGPFFDQCSASRDPVGNGLADLCIAQGVPADQIGIFEADFFPAAVSFGSNPNLQAEEADTFTAGFVWRPERIQGLEFSVDYFDIEILNATTVVFPTDAIPLCFITADPKDQYCSSFSRGPSGDISAASITFMNAAVARTSGFDIAVEHDWDADGLALFGGEASLGLSFAATHYHEAGFQASPLAPFLDCAGNFGPLCGDFVYLGALPEWRGNTRLSYHSGPLTASLRWLRIGELTNSEPEIRSITNQPPPVLAVPRVPAQDYFDLTVNARIGENFELSLGVINLSDNDPPFMGSGNRDANTDPETYDILGRRYFVRVTARY